MRTHRVETEYWPCENADGDTKYHKPLDLLGERLVRPLHVHRPLHLARIHTKNGDWRWNPRRCEGAARDDATAARRRASERAQECLGMAREAEHERKSSCAHRRRGGRSRDAVSNTGGSPSSRQPRGPLGDWYTRQRTAPSLAASAAAVEESRAQPGSRRTLRPPQMFSKAHDGASAGRRLNSSRDKQQPPQNPKAASTSSAVTRARQRRLLEEPAMLFIEAGAQWRQRKEPDTLQLAEAARTRMRARRVSEPVVHSVKWLEPPPEFVEPQSTHLFEALRSKARHTRLHELDEFGRELEVAPKEAAAPEPRKDGSSRATRRAERRASGLEGDGELAAAPAPAAAG